MPTVFSRIISGELPSHKVAEDEENLAILDINPLVEGHVLCIPKIENDYLFDLSEERYLSLMRFARRVAPAIEKVIPCERIGMAVIGLEVPHTHIHLVPMESADDLNFTRPKIHVSQERLTQLAKLIGKVIQEEVVKPDSCALLS